MWNDDPKDLRDLKDPKKPKGPKILKDTKHLTTSSLPPKLYVVRELLLQLSARHVYTRLDSP